jgi:hypothetical protein
VFGSGQVQQTNTLIRESTREDEGKADGQAESQEVFSVRVEGRKRQRNCGVIPTPISLSCQELEENVTPIMHITLI